MNFISPGMFSFGIDNKYYDYNNFVIFFKLQCFAFLLDFVQEWYNPQLKNAIISLHYANCRTDHLIINLQTSDLMTLDEEGYDRPGQGELKIVEINDGEVKTVDYGNLPEEQKKNVLADLLVKSAISHALEKQKQVPSKFKADVHIPLFSV